jgi:ribosomal-protein-alanine N-acetyltransferase
VTDEASQLTIRPLTRVDLQQVVAIERRVFQAPWSLEDFVLEIAKPSAICLVAVRGTRVVAFTICTRSDSIWYVKDVAVDPAAQRTGLGSAMLTRLFEDVHDPAARYMLDVRCSNAPAIRLYKRMGFREAEVRRGFYGHSGEDAVIMTRIPPPRCCPPASRDGRPNRSRRSQPSQI